ncbi:hypothetical protein Mpsy_2420 [Methanolobus psychrophilus R15]|nr:hypothetical protein Mpsy_2420 [Methanolobus psychrophilus R15]
MRTELKKRNNDRATFIGIFEKRGIKKGWKGKMESTVLFVDINADGHIVTDHLWMNQTTGLTKIGMLNKGDMIQFDARVKPYTKGERRFEVRDYKLSHPTKFSKLQVLKLSKELVL